MSTVMELVEELVKAERDLAYAESAFDRIGKRDRQKEVDEARAALTAALAMPTDLLEAVDDVLETAPCECSHKQRYEIGGHKSYCFLFDLDIARTKMLPTTVFDKHRPCGCVVCTCEDDNQCQGCGAKFCTDHAARAAREALEGPGTPTQPVPAEETRPNGLDAVSCPLKLSDERILHLWDIYVGYESHNRSVQKMPLSNGDKLQFARAVLDAYGLLSCPLNAQRVKQGEQTLGVGGCERGRGTPAECGAAPACGCPAALAALGVAPTAEGKKA